MSVVVTINGVDYSIPTVGEELWGTEVTDWMVAVSTELSNLVVDGDLGPTVLVTVANNQASAANVSSLSFDSAEIRSAVIEYYVYRTWNTGTEEAIESGTLYINYKDIAAEWDMVQVGANVTGSGVTFSVTSAGQVQYVSDNKTPSASYAGTLKYRARVLSKT
jgi:hypothetical protein